MIMDRSSAGALSPVDQFFELSLLGLLASGFLAVAGSGYLDAPTLFLTSAALIVRALMVAGVVHFDPPPAIVTAVTLAYIGFYPIDYFFISHAFIPAAIHMVFFVAVVKILTGRHQSRLPVPQSNRVSGTVGRVHCFGQLQLFRFPAAVPGAGRGHLCQQRDSSIAAARSVGRQANGRRRGIRAPDRRRVVRFVFDPGDYGRPLLLSASHRARRFPAFCIASLSSRRFSNHVTLGEIGEVKRRTCW
jgi:hypothetical protein